MTASDVLPSPKDDRDYMISSVASVMTPLASLPDTLDLRSDIPPIKNKLTTSAGLAFAATAVIEYHASKLRGLKYPLAPQFIYDLRQQCLDCIVGAQYFCTIG